MKLALLVINTTTFFPGLLEVARLLKNSSDFKATFYFTQPYTNHEEQLEICKKEKMAAICGFEKVNVINKDPFRLSRSQKKIKKLYLWLYKIFFIGFAYEVLSYVREFFKVKRLLKKVKPDIVVLAADNTGYNTEIFVKIAKAYRIPTVIIPLWMANANEAAEAYYSNPAHDCKKFTNRVFAFLFPKWSLFHRDKKLLRWPAFKVLAIKMFGLEPPLPWILHSGYADKIMAAHKEMEELMTGAGIKQNQVSLTGSVIDDVMAENFKNLSKRRHDICLKLGLSGKKPILLCALPPRLLYAFSRSQCDFEAYQDLLNFWIDSLAKIKTHNIVISLHPSIDYEEVKSIEERGVKIAKEKIIDLMPFCDLLVGSASSVMYFATACGKPVLNYDVYKFRDSYFMKFGMLYTDNKAEFLSLLSRLTSDKGFYSQVQSKQQAAAERFGILDGKCGERILGAVEELIAKYNA